MILVTVGTQKFPFDRLIEEVDKLAVQQKIKEPVFMQIGTSKYIPKYCEYERYLPAEVLAEKLKSCSLLITHSGVGMIRAACAEGKPIIVVPRKKEYGEHIDDHQIEIAKSFDRAHHVCLCQDSDDLEECIDKARHMTFERMKSGKKKIEEIILKFIS